MLTISKNGDVDLPDQDPIIFSNSYQLSPKLNLRSSSSSHAERENIEVIDDSNKKSTPIVCTMNDYLIINNPGNIEDDNRLVDDYQSNDPKVNKTSYGSSPPKVFISDFKVPIINMVIENQNNLQSQTMRRNSTEDDMINQIKSQDANSSVNQIFDNNTTFRTKTINNQLPIKSPPMLDSFSSEEEIAEFSETPAPIELVEEYDKPMVKITDEHKKNSFDKPNEFSRRILPLSSPNRKTMNYIQKFLQNGTPIIMPINNTNNQPILYATDLNITSYSRADNDHDITQLSDKQGFLIRPKQNLSPVESMKGILNRTVDLDGKGHTTFLDQDSTMQKKSLRSIKRGLDDLRIISRIVHYLNLHECVSLMKSNVYFTKNKKLRKIFTCQIFESLKSETITDEHLYYYFQYFINIRKIMKLHSNSYNKNLIQKSLYERDICHDIDRTFSDNGYFETTSGRDSLKNVLIAISNARKDVGYIQGLNCIVGVLLLHFSEEESYWILLYLMEKLSIKDLFNQDFKNVNMLNYQLYHFIQHYFPEVSNYLDERNMEVGYFSTAWFITLFSSLFSYKLVIKCWCAFLLKGYSILIKLALAIFGFYKDDIILRECDEAGDFLKQVIKSRESKIFEMALKFKITKRMLNGLTKFYHTSRSSELKLTPVGKKLEWVEYDKIGNRRDTEGYTTSRHTAFSFNNIQRPNVPSFMANDIQSISNYNTNLSIISSPNPTNISPKFLSSVIKTIKVDLADPIKYFWRKESIANPINSVDKNANYGNNSKDIPSNNATNLITRSLCDLDYQANNNFPNESFDHNQIPFTGIDFKINNKPQSINDTSQLEQNFPDSQSRILLYPTLGCLREEKKERVMFDRAKVIGDNDITHPDDFDEAKKTSSFSVNIEEAQINNNNNNNNKPVINDSIPNSALTSSQLSMGSQIDENISNNVGLIQYMDFLAPRKNCRANTFEYNFGNENIIDDKDQENDYEAYMNSEWPPNTPNQKIKFTFSHSK